jgi:uncharacterized RDD family membrane protein YckC
MERSVEVATGESVAFSYELAGLGSRFFAVFIDLVIQVSVAVIGGLIIVWAVTAFPLPAGGLHTGSSQSSGPQAEKIGEAILTALFIFAGFMLFVGYFIVFEWRWSGRTPGKRLLGIRVVRDGGFPVDFTAAVIRNVVRIFEASFGFYAISAVATLLSPQNRRLGDMAAGTIVVRDSRFERTTAASLRGDGREREDDVVRALTPAERELIRRYVERRKNLSLDARTTVAAQIAATIRPKLEVSFDHIDDDHLLVHLAATALG